MKVVSKSDRLEIHVEGEDVKACFEQMAHAQEVFLNTHCGACDSDNVRYVVRKTGKYTFHECRCMECGCTLAFGQRSEDGALYPRRTDKEKNRLENGGWTKWSPRDNGGDPF